MTKKLPTIRYTYVEVMNHLVSVGKDNSSIAMWLYITALRGPDKPTGNNIPKILITGFIRGGCMHAMGLHDTYSVLRHNPNTAALAKEIASCEDHYLYHASNGMKQLCLFLVDKYPGDPIIADITSMIVNLRSMVLSATELKKRESAKAYVKTLRKVMKRIDYLYKT